MAEILYIDEEDGKKRVMNNTKLYTKLLTKFRTDTKLDNLENYAEAENWEKAQAEAHTLKGIAANLSLTELFKQSLEIETQLKAKCLKPESMENLKQCFAQTIIAADRIIAQNA